MFILKTIDFGFFWQLAIGCPRLNVPNINIISLDSSPGGVVSLSCLDKRRHRHVSGDLIRTCNENETWTGTPPVCKGKQYKKTQLIYIYSLFVNHNKSKYYKDVFITKNNYIIYTCF